MSNVPVLYDRVRPGEPPQMLLGGDPGDMVAAPAGGEPMLVLRAAAEVCGCLKHPQVIHGRDRAAGLPADRG